jgi:hypothetical protein
MNKLSEYYNGAYEAGVQQAMIDAGLIKESTNRSGGITAVSTMTPKGPKLGVEDAERGISMSYADAANLPGTGPLRYSKAFGKARSAGKSQLTDYKNKKTTVPGTIRR